MSEIPRKDNMSTFIKNPWSVNDEAIHRGMNYADSMVDIVKDLRADGLTLHGALKNAYQEGFLHGFEHKFDNHNYEKKEQDGNTL